MRKTPSHLPSLNLLLTFLSMPMLLRTQPFLRWTEGTRPVCILWIVSRPPNILHWKGFLGTASPPHKVNLEKEELKFDPAQRGFDLFSAVVSDPTNTRYLNPAGPSSNTLETQDPLNPAPSAFTRPTPKNYAYLPFKPMTMISNSSNLSDGFPNVPPPVNPEGETQIGKTNPQHRFVSHDVTEED